MNNEPVAWIAYDEFGDFMLETTPEGDYPWQPLYTHPAKELDEQFKKGFEAGKEEGWKAHKFHHPAKTLTDDAIRYQWLRNEYAHGRETYLAEGIPSGEKLDEYIDGQLRKAQEK